MTKVFSAQGCVPDLGPVHWHLVPACPTPPPPDPDPNSVRTATSPGGKALIYEAPHLSPSPLRSGGRAMGQWDIQWQSHTNGTEKAMKAV